MKRIQPQSVLKGALQTVAVLSLWAIMMYTVGNVVSRVLGGGPLPAVIELITRWWMVPLVFAGWALAHLGNEHIRVEFVSGLANTAVRESLYWINNVLLVLFLALVTYGSWFGAQQNRLRGEYGIDTGAPVWTTRYAIPILTALFIVLILADMWRKLRTSARSIATAEAHTAETQGKVSHDNN